MYATKSRSVNPKTSPRFPVYHHLRWLGACSACAGLCPSPSDRRRQSPNGRPPPERARDRRGRRGVAGEECGGVSADGMAVAPPIRRRAFRVRSPTTSPDAPERGAEAADTRRTRTGLRVLPAERPVGPCAVRLLPATVRAPASMRPSADPVSGRAYGPSGCAVAAVPTTHLSLGRVRTRFWRLFIVFFMRQSCRSFF